MSRRLWWRLPWWHPGISAWQWLVCRCQDVGGERAPRSLLHPSYWGSTVLLIKHNFNKSPCTIRISSYSSVVIGRNILHSRAGPVFALSLTFVIQHYGAVAWKIQSMNMDIITKKREGGEGWEEGEFRKEAAWCINYKGLASSTLKWNTWIRKWNHQNWRIFLTTSFIFRHCIHTFWK